MAIKCRKTQLANNPNAAAPKFNFKTYEQVNAPFHNNDTDIDFVTYNDSLYVCVSDGARYVSGDPANNGFLLLVGKGRDGRQGIDGAEGPIGPMPELWMRFNGKQLEIGDQTARKAISPDLTGPSWFPELHDKKIVWRLKENGDGSVPSDIDLEELRPIEDHPILLRLNSDNTRRSDETFGPGKLIQWKREGNAEWTNLMSISELMNLAMAGCCIWSETNPDTERTEYHFGHRQVLQATYDASKLNGNRIAEVELGDVLFDAGAIDLPDWDARLDALQDEICTLSAKIPILNLSEIVRALGYTPTSPSDVDNALKKIRLRIDNEKHLWITTKGSDAPAADWIDVGRTCECSPEQSSRTPSFVVMLSTPNANDPTRNVNAQYQGTDYKVNISGNGINNTYNYGQFPQLTVGETYTFTVVMPTAMDYTGSPKTVKFDGSAVELWANKNAVAPTQYTVTITKSPASAVVKVNGVTYSSPIQVESGTVINVKATASGYEDWINSYTITSNKTINISMVEKESAETSTSCVVTINSITPYGATVYYAGQQVHAGDTFTVAKGSSMHFTGAAVEGYNALDKDYRVFYNDTQSIDIVFDAITPVSTVGYYDVTIRCNVADAMISAVGLMNAKDPIVVNGVAYDQYVLDTNPQTIKVKQNISITCSASCDGYYSDNTSVRIDHNNYEINLVLRKKSTVDYSNHLLIFKSAQDELGNPIQAPVTVLYSQFYELGTEAVSLEDILKRQEAGDYLQVSDYDEALTVMAFAEGYEPFLQESFSLNADGNIVITPTLTANSGDFFWITPIDHLLDNHSTYLEWAPTPNEPQDTSYDCKPVTGPAGYYRIAILCASSNTVSASYTGDVTRTNATSYAYVNDSFDRYASFENYGILFVTGYVSHTGKFAEVDIASGSETKVVNLYSDNLPTPNCINFDIPDDVVNLNIVAKVDNTVINIPLNEQYWVANGTVLNVVATSANYEPINTGDVTINDHYHLQWQKSTEPGIIVDPLQIQMPYTASSRNISVTTFNFDGTPTINASVNDNRFNVSVVDSRTVAVSSNLNTGTEINNVTVTITATYQSTTKTAYVSLIQDANPSPTEHVTDVAISPKSATLEIGQTQQAQASITPPNATNQSVTWSSTDTSVATVDNSGLITAVSEGTAIIKATSVDGSLDSDPCLVTVVAATPQTYTASVNNTSNEGVIKLSTTSNNGPWENAPLTGLSDGTRVWLKATRDHYQTIIRSDVIDGENLVFTISNQDWIASQVTYTVTLVNDDLDQPSDQNIFYSVNNGQEIEWYDGDVITEDEYSTIVISVRNDEDEDFDYAIYTGLNENELTENDTITLGDDYMCFIKWFRRTRVSGVQLNYHNLGFNGIGQTEQLVATISPQDADDQSVSWDSSDDNVATVDSDGEVTTTGYGTATITVTTNDGDYTDTCSVTVNTPTTPYVNQLSLDESQITLEPQGDVTLDYYIGPSNLDDKSVTWSSSDNNIATVDSSGSVTGVNIGTATITVTSVAETEQGQHLTDTCTVNVVAHPTYCATWTNESGAEDEDISVKFATSDDDWENVSESNSLCNLSNSDTVYLHIERQGWLPVDKYHTIWHDDYEFEVTDADWVPEQLIITVDDDTLSNGDVATITSVYCSSREVSNNLTDLTSSNDNLVSVDIQRLEITAIATPVQDTDVTITASYDWYGNTVTGSVTITVLAAGGGGGNVSNELQSITLGGITDEIGTDNMYELYISITPSSITENMLDSLTYTVSCNPSNAAEITSYGNYPHILQINPSADNTEVTVTATVTYNGVTKTDSQTEYFTYQE